MFIVTAWTEDGKMAGRYEVETKRLAQRLMERILERDGRTWWSCEFEEVE